MIFKQIFIFLFVIFSLVQLIICPPTLEKDTTSVKSDVGSKNDEVTRTSPITTNKTVIQKTPLPQKSFVAAQANVEPSGTFDAEARILTKPSGTTSKTSKKLPSLTEPPVVDDKKTTEFSQNKKSLPITAEMPRITLSSPKPIVESPKTLSRTQPQSSGAPAVTVSLKAPSASLPYKQSNLAPKTLFVVSPKPVKIEASQPAETSPIVSRTLSKSIEAPVVAPQRKPVAPIQVLQQNPATLIVAPTQSTQSNTLPNVSTTTFKLSSAIPKIKVEPAKLSFVTSRSVSIPTAKLSGSVSRSSSLPSKQSLKSQKELVSSPNVPVASMLSVSTANAPLKRTPSQNIVYTQPSKHYDDNPERKGTYDTDHDNVELSKGLQKQNSKRIPEVKKRPMNWAWKPAKLAWQFANVIKNKVTGNNAAT